MRLNSRQLRRFLVAIWAPAQLSSRKYLYARQIQQSFVLAMYNTSANKVFSHVWDEFQRNTVENTLPVSRTTQAPRPPSWHINPLNSNEVSQTIPVQNICPHLHLTHRHKQTKANASQIHTNSWQTDTATEHNPNFKQMPKNTQHMCSGKYTHVWYACVHGAKRMCVSVLCMMCACGVTVCACVCCIPEDWRRWPSRPSYADSPLTLILAPGTKELAHSTWIPAASCKFFPCP